MLKGGGTVVLSWHFEFYYNDGCYVSGRAIIAI